MKCVVVALLVLLVTTTAGADQRVDALFAAYDRRDSPGCVTAVSRGEEILHRNAYGMASIELQVRNAPDTVMQAGSIGKQFTAAAILLLEQDGKLALADPIRKYVPELPPYANAVTLEHLLHHTSGIRDSGELLWIAGGKDDDPWQCSAPARPAEAVPRPRPRPRPTTCRPRTWRRVGRSSGTTPSATSTSGPTLSACTR
jgi:CubicO group peptidase (beta-lactamase class C family)